MAEQDSINEIFFKYLLDLSYDENDLDYSVIDTHKAVLQTLAETTNSGVSIFDFSRKENIFYSSNFGQLLGYSPSDYNAIGHPFFADLIHPSDRLDLSKNAVTAFKLYSNFSREDKLNHKLINEYRMLNSTGNYLRLIEQYQMLELTKKGQVWLVLSFVDLSPNQEDYTGIKSQLLNFKTGNFIYLKETSPAQFELTKREIQILKLVKDGYLSKEISDKLFISVHTVNTHRQRFLEKLGASNSFEAVKFASKFGLLE